MPATNLFGTYVGEIFTDKEDLVEHPHLTAFWIPRLGAEIFLGLGMFGGWCFAFVKGFFPKRLSER